MGCDDLLLVEKQIQKHRMIVSNYYYQIIMSYQMPTIFSDKGKVFFPKMNG